MAHLDSYEVENSKKDRHLLEKKMAEYFDYAKFYEVKRRFENFSESQGSSKDSKRNQKIFMRLMHIAFGVDFGDLLKESDIYTRYNPVNTSLSNLLDLEPTFSGDEEDIGNPNSKPGQSYIELLEPYIKGAKRYWVYQYLGQGQRDLDLHSSSVNYIYDEIHRRFFATVENQIEKEVLKEYRRFIAIPYSDLSDLSEVLLGEVTDENIAAKALIRLSIPHYEHIWKCFSYVELRSEYPSFYIINKPTRLYHFGIIDSDTVVSEYYRYKLRGDFVPSLLFIDHAKPDNSGAPFSRLMETYKTELKKMADVDSVTRRGFRLYKTLFVDASNRALALLESKKSELEKEMKESTEPEIWYNKDGGKARMDNIDNQIKKMEEKLRVIT